MVGDGGGRGGAAVPAAALYPRRHAHPRRHARPRDRGGARHQCAARCARSISPSASSSPASRGVLAGGQLGLEPTMGTGLLMPSFIAIIVGGVGSLAGTLARRAPDRRRLGRHRRVLPVGERGGHLRADGGRPADPPARPAGRGRHADVSGAASAMRALAVALGAHLGGAAARRRSGCRSSAATPRSARACWCWRSPRCR